MTPQLINSWAPKPASGKALVTTQAGIDHPTDSQTGMPLPYFQEQGGQRQYYDGLRGRLPEEGGLAAEVEAFAPASPFGNRRLADEPPVPMGDELTASYTQTQRNNALFGPRSPDNTPGSHPPQFRLDIPGGGLRGAASDVVTPPPENLMRADGFRAPAGTPDRLGNRDTTGRGQTLGDIIAQSGFRIPTMNDNNIGTAAGTHVGNAEPSAINNFERPEGNRGLFSGRADDVAAFLRANGVRVTSTRRRRNARAGGHPEGNSIDIDPRDQALARRLLSGDNYQNQYGEMPWEIIDIPAGQDFGNGVRSTGHHAHIDLGPAAQ